MTKRKDTESSCGPMAGAIGENGSMENSMEKEPMLLLLAKRSMVSGKMEKESDGSVEVNKIDLKDY